MKILNPETKAKKENQKTKRVDIRVSEKERKVMKYMAKKHKKSGGSDYLLWLVKQDVKRNREVKNCENL